jgi:chromosome segregation ATPase
MSKIKQEIKDHLSKIEQLNIEVIKLKSALQHGEGQKKTTDSVIDELNSNLETLRKNISGMREEIEQLKLKVGTKEQLVLEAKGKTDAANKELASAGQVNDNLKQVVEKTDAEKKELQRKLNTLTGVKEDLDKENNSQFDKIHN